MQLRVLYRATMTSGSLRPETDGSSIDAAWIPLDELSNHTVSTFVLEALRATGDLTERLTS